MLRGRGSGRVMGRASFRSWLWALPVVVSCAARPPVDGPWSRSDNAAWTSAQRWLERARDHRQRAPWSAGIRASIRSASSGGVLEGRGGLAVAPGRAVRIVLVMAGGPTLLDAWVTEHRWRVAVPARGTVERGSDPAPDGLPVSFLRRWFLHPLEGTLVAVAARDSYPAMLVVDRGGAMEIRTGRCERGELTRTTRLVGGRATEQIDECLAPGGPKSGNWAHYADMATGLNVDVMFESDSVGIPEDAAFADPDDASASRE